MFHHPVWAVGSYSSGPPAVGTSQNITLKTLRPIDSPAMCGVPGRISALLSASDSSTEAAMNVARMTINLVVDFMVTLKLDGHSAKCLISHYTCYRIF